MSDVGKYLALRAAAATKPSSAGPSGSAGNIYNPFPPSPLRFVATRGQVPSQTSNGLQSMMSRYACFARDNLTSIKVGWANRCADGTMPNIAGNVMTVAASIEYPSGTLTQIKFAGLNSGSALPLAALWSDVANVNIPNNAQFWIRTWQTGTVGILFHACPVNTVLGEASNYPSSNQTMSGSVTPGASQIFGPHAIIGNTDNRTALIIGDSRQAGVTDNQLSAIGGIGEMGNGLNAYGHSIYAQPGNTAGNYIGAFSAFDLELAQYATDIVNCFGINDLNSITAAQLQTAQATIRARYLANRYRLTTLDPSATSGNSFVDLAGQASSASNAQRVIYNTAVRSNGLGYDPFFDCAAISESSLNSGKWKVDGTANKYTSDGLHQSPFCNALYAAAGFTL